jgi:hypothetical protein
MSNTKEYLIYIKSVFLEITKLNYNKEMNIQHSQFCFVHTGH